MRNIDKSWINEMVQSITYNMVIIHNYQYIIDEVHNRILEVHDQILNIVIGIR